MAKTDAKKRNVQYANFDEMLVDVSSLANGGYIKNGNWSLGQACGHVAQWMQFPLDGFPKPPFFMRAIFGVMQVTGMSKRMAAKIISEGFKGGMPTAPETVPAENTADAEGVAELQKVVDQLNQHSGSLHPSPLFGEMDMAQHIKVSLLHAEHHFAYLQPT